jgi:1,4-dihydroxy-2-naphthoate octaprenyltransferase/chlorophyll synthase
MKPIEEWTTSQRWRYAIKPKSWPKLLVPMLLGQALGIVAAGQISFSALLFGLAFTILDGLYIVLLNDWGDREVDRLKRRMFPEGCSPKTIPDGILPARHLLVAGSLAGVGAIGVSVIAAVVLGRPGLGFAAIACLGIFAGYTLPPIQLNYRGGGEVLEALGVGIALPWVNAYLQSGVAMSLDYFFLAGFLLLSLASALASGLSDERSDRAGGKRTCTTMLGNASVRRATDALLTWSIVAWAVAAFIHPDVPVWAVGPAALIVAQHKRRLRRVSPKAVTDAFDAHREFKLHLHRAIWYGALALAVTLLLLRS